MHVLVIEKQLISENQTQINQYARSSHRKQLISQNRT